MATARCAPPDNKPLPEEIRNCAHFLDREIDLLPRLKVALALGAIGWRAYLDHASRVHGVSMERPLPAFAHGKEVRVGGVVLLGSYHVSQQNTQTGRLTPAMFDRVLRRAKELAG